MRKEGDAAGSESGGLPVDALAAQADARYRRLSELLPPGRSCTPRYSPTPPGSSRMTASTSPSTPHGITEYELPGSERRVSAVTFSSFLEHLTDIDHIDPSLLAVAFGPLT